MSRQNDYSAREFTIRYLCSADQSKEQYIADASAYSMLVT